MAQIQLFRNTNFNYLMIYISGRIAATYKLFSTNIQLLMVYRIAGMFGGAKVWRNATSEVVGEKKFGEFDI